jgi:catechol 2,3-dioxygenase-like lactoylglutathione lyase family enzyme
VEFVADVAARSPEPAVAGERSAGRTAARARTGSRTRPGARAGIRFPVGTQAVVERPLVRVGQDGVRLVDLLEPHLGRGVTALRIRVVFAGELAEGLLDLFL